MSYVQEWQLIKRNFENATGRKKPSTKFMGVFGRPSGIEPLCKDIDTALAAKDAAKALKKLEDYERKCGEYQRTLAASAVGADSNLAAEIKVMIGELSLLGQKMRAEAGKLDDAKKQLETLAVGWKAIAADFARSTLPDNADLKRFTSEASVALLASTGAKDARLAGFQATVKQKLADFKRALGPISTFKIGADFDTSTREFVALLHAAQDTLTLNTGGLMDALGQWSGAQRTSITTAPARKNAFEQSDAWQLFNRVNEAVSAENERLGKLEMSFERQVLRTR